MEPTPWWSIRSDEAIERLETTADGLGSEEARALLGRYGPNTIRAWQRRRGTGLG